MYVSGIISLRFSFYVDISSNSKHKIIIQILVVTHDRIIPFRLPFYFFAKQEVGFTSTYQTGNSSLFDFFGSREI